MKDFELFGIAVGIGADESFRIVFPAYLCFAVADRAFAGDFQAAALCQIFCYLRDDHIRFINGYRIADAKLEFFYDADIVDAGAADRCAFQFYRVEDGYRIDKPRPAGAPFYFTEGCLGGFVRPFKGDGVAREFAVLPRASPYAMSSSKSTSPSEGMG